jgi:D-alanyl-D-alanine carboxypeptidase
MWFLYVILALWPVKEVQKDKGITKAELLGQFEPASDTNFVYIDTLYTAKEKIMLRKPAYHAYKEMYEAALAEGIDLQILSATRNFNYQKQIWEGKWEKAKTANQNKKHITDADIALNILKFSAMPGTSRHHWGTDIDLVSLEPSFFKSPEGKKALDWLEKNAPAYGFCQPYKDKSAGRTGYENEPWHWSYLPLSSIFFNAYRQQITYKDIKGFSGAEVAKELKVIEKYVAGIAQDCILVSNNIDNH